MASNPEPSQSSSDTTTPYTLITYFRSSCSGRLRIALNLKSLPYTPIYVNLLAGEQHSASNLAYNPSHTVPTLIPNKNITSSPEDFHVPQSLAALEYLDEIHPNPPLLPSDPEKRAIARTLANIITSDTQPVTNLRILSRISNLAPGTAEEKAAARATWAKELLTDGLAAYEAVAGQYAGKYSVGDDVSIADVCLVPTVWGAERFGVDMGMFPTVVRVFARMAELEAVQKAHWKVQGDTPEGLR